MKILANDSKGDLIVKFLSPDEEYLVLESEVQELKKQLQAKMDRQDALHFTKDANGCVIGIGISQELSDKLTKQCQDALQNWSERVSGDYDED